MEGLRRRHRDISDACRQMRTSRVAFYDLKKFYPSIGIEIARNAWDSACAEARLPKITARLGNELLERHGNEFQGGMLVGPMFSHLIGNLLLRNIDERMASSSVRYFRYVDDIALVGSSDEINRTYAKLKAEMEALGLTLHDQSSSKSIAIDAEDWLQGEHDYAGHDGANSWMTLIGGVKSLLLWRPEAADELRGRLNDHEIRLPLPDYISAVREHGYLARARHFVRKKYWRLRTHSTSVNSLVEQALHLRKHLDDQLSSVMRELGSPSQFHVRRHVPKARYRLGRLAYLATPRRLTELAGEASHPALRFHSEVCKAIGTRQVTDLFELGSNAVQAAAQALRATPSPIDLDQIEFTEVTQQSLATAYLNGLEVRTSASTLSHQSRLVQFARGGPDAEMMADGLPFLSEAACLHGLSAEPRHQSILDSAFDEDEDLAMDVIEQARSSLSG